MALILEASYQSSNGRTTPQTCLKTGKIMTNIELPNLIIKYLNIIFKSDLKNFIKKSVESGIDCFIIPDISIEESNEYMMEASNLRLATIFLASPNTNDVTLKCLLQSLQDFYIWSLYRTTGIRKSFDKYTKYHQKKDDTKSILVDFRFLYALKDKAHRIQCKFLVRINATTKAKTKVLLCIPY